MKFGDKLTQLRKKQGLSQEELGEKLNVTRQTVSKWELSQSKPDTDKLLEICKLLEVDIKELTDDEVALENKPIVKKEKFDDIKPRKWLQIVLIVIALGIFVVLANKFITDVKERNKNRKNIFDIFDASSISKDAFNSTFEYNSGSRLGFLLTGLFDDIISSNQKNPDHLVTLIYGEYNTTDANEIRQIKYSIQSGDKFEVILDYDDNGFVNKITLELTEKDKSKIESFNRTFEIDAGTHYGVSTGSVLDDVIQNNNTNKDHLVMVVFGSTKTTDVTKIKNLKKKFDTWTKYEVSVEYDDAGYVNKLIIEK